MTQTLDIQFRQFKMISEVATTYAPPNKVQTITLPNRETQILRLISMELTTNEIAQKLYLSPETIRSHRRHLLHKLWIVLQRRKYPEELRKFMNFLA